MLMPLTLHFDGRPGRIHVCAYTPQPKLDCACYLDKLFFAELSLRDGFPPGVDVWSPRNLYKRSFCGNYPYGIASLDKYIRESGAAGLNCFLVTGSDGYPTKTFSERRFHFVVDPIYWTG